MPAPKILQRMLRKSAQASLTASGQSPTSGLATAANFTGASRAVAELSQTLGIALEEIDLSGNIGSQAKGMLEQLDARASEYANSSVDFCTSVEPWSCDAAELELISTAWLCAADAYHPCPTSTLLKPSLYREWLVSASLSSTHAKVVTGSTLTPLSSNDTAWLIVAVRGSASGVDHIVNLHSDPADASSLFPGTDCSDVRLSAHAGFLNSAEATMTQIAPRIEQHLTQNGRSNVLVTGHSAGGAVASLLHLAMMARWGTSHPHSVFLCITFGSPPVARTWISDHDAARDRLIARGRCLNIINEYDFIARADPAYIRSMAELHQLEAAPGHIDKVWSLPPPDFQHLGEVVMLKTALQTSDPQDDASSNMMTTLSAWKLTPLELSQLVFCRLLVHRRSCYQDRIQQFPKYLVRASD